MIKKILPLKLKKYIKTYIEKNYKETYITYKNRTIHANKFENKNIIVTGGTGAIGSAICKKLLMEGATVGIAGRSNAKILETLEIINNNELVQEGVAIPLNMDVTNQESIKIAIEYFVEKAGQIDVLINNAGGGARENSKPIYEQNVEIIDSVLNTNLRGTILCSKLAIPHMLHNNSGKIINMSSIVGLKGKKTMSDYAASKAGIIGFTKSLALELGEYNITVNCISPGMVNQIPFDSEMPIRYTNCNCLKRFGYTDEVADLVSFIISEEADYITGNNFVIDGGRSLGLMGDSN